MSEPGDNIKDLIARLRGDQEFKQRVIDREERERDRQRPQWRKNMATYNERHKDGPKVLARDAVKRAIASGELKPALCALRGPECRGRLETHHWHGYAEAQWLDIVWLCRYHHAIETRKELFGGSH